MSEARLEWSGPAGPAELSLLAGPWRRGEVAAHELFCVDLDRPAAPSPPDPLPLLAAAAARLHAALRPTTTREAPRREAQLRAALRAPPDLPSVERVGHDLAELWRRAAAPATVETRRGARLGLVTRLGARGPTVTRIALDAPAELIAAHSLAVAAALRTRLALMRAAHETLALAATIAAGGGPAAVWLALPLAWRSLHTLLAEPAGD